MHLAILWPILFFGLLSPVEHTLSDVDHAYAVKRSKAICHVINETVKELEIKYKFVSGGPGGGRKTDKKISLQGMAFQFYGPLSKEEGRKFLVEATELFVKNINSDQNLQQYLYEPPFSYKNIEVSVFLYTSEGHFLYEPNISVVSLSETGIVAFCSDDLKSKKTFQYKTKETEPYTESLRIVREQEKASQKPVPDSL